MKVILLKDMVNLGGSGDTVLVKDGYAKNYLIPREIAVRSSKGALKTLEAKKRGQELRDKRTKKKCEELAKRITEISCTIPVDVGENDKLFGSVTSEMISDCLRAEGAVVDKKKITLEEPIKALGVYNVEIRLHPEVKTHARVWIVKK